MEYSGQMLQEVLQDIQNKYSDIPYKRNLLILKTLSDRFFIYSYPTMNNDVNQQHIVHEYIRMNDSWKIELHSYSWYMDRYMSFSGLSSSGEL
jgi:hypothetical protein